MAGKRRSALRISARGVLLFVAALAAGAVAWRIYRDWSGRDFDPDRSFDTLEQVARSEVPADLPNIVILFADDLGDGDVFGYGARLIETPNLDRMAANGVRLTCFYATAPVCSPSRAGLLTGRYPIRTHMTLPLYPTGHPMSLFLTVIGRYPHSVTGIPQDELLLQELLQRRGYRTGMVGKWHLGDRSPHLPNDSGFEFFYGVLYSNDVTPFAVYRNREVEVPAPANQDLLTERYTREAVQFIRDHRQDPFFLYLAYTTVHEPIHASTAFRGRSAAGLYGDAVEELDWSVGQILKTLESQGLEQRTLVLFTSDNGPWWQGNPGALRGRKTNVTEGGFRVPFVAHWPGVLPAGLVSNEPGINFDLFVTCLQIAGVPLPDDRIIDGKDLLPVLQGKAPSPHETFYYYFGHELVAVRHGNWKYHRRYMSDNGGYPLFKQGPFLFDLDRDPQESYSLIESEPKTAARLARMLDDWEATMAANVRGWRPQTGSTDPEPHFASSGPSLVRMASFP
jgi:arylsulfatase A